MSNFSNSAADDSLMYAAYHEAGHAVMALDLGLTIAEVAVKTPSAGYMAMRRSHQSYLHNQAGSSSIASPIERLQKVLNRIYVLLAGPAAEYEVRKLPHFGPGTQYFVDHDIINELLCHEPIRRSFEQHVPKGLTGLQAEVENWVADSRAWERIEVLAEAILHERWLSGDAIVDWLTLAEQRVQLRMF